MNTTKNVNDDKERIAYYVYFKPIFSSGNFSHIYTLASHSLNSMKPFQIVLIAIWPKSSTNEINLYALKQIPKRNYLCYYIIMRKQTTKPSKFPAMVKVQTKFINPQPKERRKKNARSQTFANEIMR